MGKRNYTHVQALLPEIIAKQPILSAQHEGSVKEFSQNGLQALA